LSRHLFYRIEAGRPLACDTSLPTRYRIETWRPQRDGLPDRLPYRPFAIWWLFDRLGLFSSRHAGVAMIFEGDRLVHRSLVTPRWYRFPDMGPRDLQIGDTWTDEAHRGKGLARAAIGAIHAHWAGQYERMWYLTEADNRASVRVIEACGYALAGSGERTRRLGLAALGQFVVTEAAP
jgi:RimJ/RimL family protein N-acetyltransferase